MSWFAAIKQRLLDRKCQKFVAVDAMPEAKRFEYYAPIIEAVFKKENLPWEWGLAIAKQETNFRATTFTVSGDERPNGFYGLMMVSVARARMLGFKDDPGRLCIPQISALWCARLLRSETLMRSSGSSIRDVLARYKIAAGTDPGLVSSVYVPNVLKYAAEYRQLHVI